MHNLQLKAAFAIVLLFPVLGHGAANCFAHTSTYGGGGQTPVTSPPMDTTGAAASTSPATLLVAVLSTYAGFLSVIHDSVGTRDWNTTSTYQDDSRGGSQSVVLYKVLPTVSTSYTFSMPTATGGGATTVSATMWACNGTSSDIHVMAQQTGLATSNGFGGATWQPGAVTPLEVGDLIFEAGSVNNSTAPTVSIDSGFPAPVVFKQSGYMVSASTWQAATSTASINPTWTTNASPWQGISVVFRAAGASSPTSSGYYAKTIVGTGLQDFGGDGGPALNAYMNYPGEIVKTSNGLYCFADVNNNRIRCFNTTGSSLTTYGVTIAPGNIATIAGSSTTVGFVDNVAPLSAQFGHPVAMAIDASDCMFIGDQQNARIRKMCPGGNVTTVAGGGGCSGCAAGVNVSGCSTPGHSDPAGGIGGDGGPATLALLNCPQGVAIDSAKNILLADTGNYRIRVVNTQTTTQTLYGVSVCAGCIQTITGAANACSPHSTALASYVASMLGLATDSANTLYFVGYACHQADKITTSGAMTILAGTGTPGFSGDGGPATSAQLQFPFRANVTPSGDLYIADTNNQAIRFVNHTTGIISTIAGNPSLYPHNGTLYYGGGGYCCDNSWAKLAGLQYPVGLEIDVANNLIYVSDLGNSRIRQLYLPFVTSTGAFVSGKTKITGKASVH